MNKPYIIFNEKGNTLFDIPYSTYRAFDEMLSRNDSSANGLWFLFTSREQAEMLLKRATKHCFLFRVEDLGGWKRAIPEIEILETKNYEK